MERAELVETEAGLQPRGDGWFVVNVREAAWRTHPTFGSSCGFEGTEHFSDYGINVHVIGPGQVSSLYHRETVQEDFLVLAGECIAVVDGEERRLRAWDFVHCPAGTDHVFVGVDAGPCAILMVGARRDDAEITYPVSEAAGRYGASVDEETDDPRVAYAPHGHKASARPGETVLGLFEP